MGILKICSSSFLGCIRNVIKNKRPQGWKFKVFKRTHVARIEVLFLDFVFVRASRKEPPAIVIVLWMRLVNVYLKTTSELFIQKEHQTWSFIKWNNLDQDHLSTAH